VKCHSKRLSSKGSAWRSGEAFEASSEASFTGGLSDVFQIGWERRIVRIRFIVGFLVLNWPRVDMMVVAGEVLWESKTLGEVAL
jgi:hypothetical protein